MAVAWRSELSGDPWEPVILGLESLTHDKSHRKGSGIPHLGAKGLHVLLGQVSDYCAGDGIKSFFLNEGELWILHSDPFFIP